MIDFQAVSTQPKLSNNSTAVSVVSFILEIGEDRLPSCLIESVILSGSVKVDLREWPFVAPILVDLDRSLVLDLLEDWLAECHGAAKVFSHDVLGAQLCRDAAQIVELRGRVPAIFAEVWVESTVLAKDCLLKIVLILRETHLLLLPLNRKEVVDFCDSAPSVTDARDRVL